MAYNLPAPYAISVKDEPFFAKGDGVADDTAAFVAAFAAKEARGGGIIRIPLGRYKITSQINVGTKACQVLGEGFSDASTSYASPTNNVGSILVCSGSGGLVFSSDPTDGPANFFVYKDFAIIGPGTGGGTTGLSLVDTGPGSSISRIDNVGVFNFSIGILISNLEDVVMHHPVVWNNDTGIVLTNVPNDTRIYDLNANANSIGVLVADGAGIHFVGGLVQSNTTYGISIVPDGYAGSSGGAIQSVTMQNLWMENNTSGAIHFDSTTNAIENVEVNNCRFSVASFAFVGGNTIGLHVGAGNYFIISGTLTIPNTVSGWWDATTSGQTILNNSPTFYFRDRPGSIEVDIDFSSTSSSDQIALEYPFIDVSVVAQIKMTVTATNGTDSAVWTDIPISLASNGAGSVTYLGGVSGEIGPSAFTSGAGGWLIDITAAGSVPHFPIILVSGPSAANWRIRMRGDQHS